MRKVGKRSNFLSQKLNAGVRVRTHDLWGNVQKGGRERIFPGLAPGMAPNRLLSLPSDQPTSERVHAIRAATQHATRATLLIS